MVQGDGRQLHQKGVPGMTLVRAQPGKVAHAIGGQCDQQFGQAAALHGGVRVTPANQWLVQEIQTQFNPNT